MVGWCVCELPGVWGLPRGRPRAGAVFCGPRRRLLHLVVIFFFFYLLSIRLKFKFKRGSLPPTMPLEFIGCIGGCDETLREILDLRFSRGAPRAGQPASQPSGYLQAGRSLNRTDSSQHSHPQPPGARQTRPLKALAQNQPPPIAAGESNSVVCNCGQEALLLTVRKEGPNQGRQFYKCQGGSCSFFLWANSSHPETGGSPSSSARHPTVSGNHPHGLASPSDDSGGGTSCLCSQATVTRTVQKDGPNKGRQFHTCAKPREQQCGFFQWVDENVAPGEEHTLCHSSTTGSSSRAGQVGRAQPCLRPGKAEAVVGA